MSVSSGSPASWVAKVPYSALGWPPPWQFPAPALNRVSPQNSAGWSVWDNRQTWLMVCPGVSRTSSSTVLPTVIVSPALKPRSMPGILSFAFSWASSEAPVAAITARLPPMWSPCSWVFSTWVMSQPCRLAAARHFT